MSGENFVTRKITLAVAKIALGIQETVYMGNLDAQRDWGHAKDYVEAMWLMLQQEEAEDFVIATGVTTSIRTFIEKAFGQVGVELAWEGTGTDETAVVKRAMNPDHPVQEGQVVVRIDPKYYRPTEVDLLIGDASKAQQKLGWTPRIELDELVASMIEEDLKYARRHVYLEKGGHRARQFREE